MDIEIKNLDLLRSYILQLSNYDIYELDEISLSSAQKARVASWCDANNIEIPDLNNKTFWKDPIQIAKNPKAKKEFYMNNTSDLLAGIDIQNISEFLSDIKEFSKNDKDLLSIFTNRELSYAESKSNTRETLAGIFAAKESIYKCNNFEKRNWSDIELKIINDKPTYPGYAISISHSGEYAIATAIFNISTSNQESLLSNLKEETHSNNFDKPISKSLYEYFLVLGSLGGLFFLFYYIMNFIFI